MTRVPRPTIRANRFSMAGVNNYPLVSRLLRSSVESGSPYTSGYGSLDVIGGGGGAGTLTLVFKDSPNDFVHNAFGSASANLFRAQRLLEVRLMHNCSL